MALGDWVDGAAGGTPLSAARLNERDTAIVAAADSATWAGVTGKPSTFPPAIGTSGTTAKAGNYQPTAANISDATAVGRSVLTAADAAAARTAIGAGTSNAAATAAGTRAQLDAGTDTEVRAWSAKDIAEYVAAEIAAGAA